MLDDLAKLDRLRRRQRRVSSTIDRSSLSRPRGSPSARGALVAHLLHRIGQLLKPRSQIVSGECWAVWSDCAGVTFTR